MLYLASPHRPQATSLHGWHLSFVGAVCAVFLQLWGLYRVVGPPQLAWFPSADKLEHAAGFALPVMLILLTVALRSSLSWPELSFRTLALVVAVFAAHAVVSEVIQHMWYRHRLGDPLDVLADWAGITVGVLVLRLILRSRRPGDGLATP
jgi:hypothetical protein